MRRSGRGGGRPDRERIRVAVEKSLTDLQLATGDLFDKAGGVLQGAESRETALQEALQLGKTSSARRPAGQTQQGAQGRL